MLQGETEAGRALFERSDGLLESALGEDHPLAVYNRACFHALIGDRDRAIRYLEQSLDLGYSDPAMVADPDFESLF